ncbi:MAG TPA: hypothetical protein VFI53_05765 [Myxococcaceae bacterium]|nr:hypothetical protein [Myxococcaceae bacterium]
MSRAFQSRRPARGNLEFLLRMGAVLFLVVLADRAGMKLLNGVPLARLPAQLIPSAFLWSVALLVFIPSFLLAERAASSWGRAVPYTFLVVAGSALVTALVLPLGARLGLAPPGSSAPPPFPIFLMILMRMGLAAFVYAGLRERLEGAQALQSLEKRRNDMLRRLAASRLDAARARVRPEAFIAELRALRGTYVDDPAAGGAGLEALITRLRTASQSTAP